MSLIAVKHNMEVAHRMWLTTGKCQRIHGHSMWVTIFLSGNLDENGFLDGVEFGQLKKHFRGYLDSEYDHSLLLNRDDDWAKSLRHMNSGSEVPTWLPGLKTFASDPTTENLAMWIGKRMAEDYPVAACEVWETSVNMARWES